MLCDDLPTLLDRSTLGLSLLAPGPPRTAPGLLHRVATSAPPRRLHGPPARPGQRRGCCIGSPPPRPRCGRLTVAPVVRVAGGGAFAAAVGGPSLRATAPGGLRRKPGKPPPVLPLRALVPAPSGLRPARSTCPARCACLMCAPPLCFAPRFHCSLARGAPRSRVPPGMHPTAAHPARKNPRAGRSSAGAWWPQNPGHHKKPGGTPSFFHTLRASGLPSPFGLRGSSPCLRPSGCAASPCAALPRGTNTRPRLPDSRLNPSCANIQKAKPCFLFQPQKG